VKFILYGVSIMVLLTMAVVGGIFLYVLLRLALVKNCEEYDCTLDHLRDPCYSDGAKREKNDFFEEPI
jgi:hypothetical protein